MMTSGVGLASDVRRAESRGTLATSRSRTSASNAGTVPASGRTATAGSGTGACSRCAARRRSRGMDVTQDEIGPHVCGELGHVELLALVDGTPAHQHLVTLVEAEAPSEGRALALGLERLAFVGQDLCGEVGTVADDSEQTCHRWSPRSSRSTCRASCAFYCDAHGPRCAGKVVTQPRSRVRCVARAHALNADALGLIPCASAVGAGTPNLAAQ